MSDEKRNAIYYRLNAMGRWVRCDDSSESFDYGGRPLVKPNEPLPEPRQGFYRDVDGVTAHVQGNPKMSAEELELIDKIIRAAMKMMKEKDNPDAESDNQAD